MGLDKSAECRGLNQLTIQIIEKRKRLQKLGRIGTFIMCLIPQDYKKTNKTCKNQKDVIWLQKSRPVIL